VKTLTMIGATCAVLLASAAVFAQDKPMRVRGTVEQIDGAMMTVKSREGDTLKVKLADEVKEHIYEQLDTAEERFRAILS